MSTLARAANGDLALAVVGNVKQIQLVTDPSTATAIKLQDRFNFWLGEWFLDVRQGVPYLTTVFVKNPDINAIRQLFRKIILTTPNIVSVAELVVNYNPGQRSLFYSFAAIDNTGATITGGSGQPFIVASRGSQGSAN